METPRRLKEGKTTRKTYTIILTLLLATGCITAYTKTANAWSNGGYSTDPANPKYGTHDWIAQHALDWLPTNEKQYITDNLAAYLYGTELPDNNVAPDRIGDTAKHHIYYRSSGTLQDDAAAVRASTEYQTTLNFLNAKDYPNAAKTAGIMSHYIVDVAVFAHVMGSGTDWGAETGNIHTNYENYVDTRTNSYSDTYNTYLSFDGTLATVSAYDAARNLALDATFDHGGTYTCVWMNNNYNTSNPNSPYWNRAGESLNLAVNALTDILHTLYVNSSSQSTPTPTVTPTPSPTPSPTPTTTLHPTTAPTSNPTPTPTSTSTSISPTPAPTTTPSQFPNPSPTPETSQTPLSSEQPTLSQSTSQNSTPSPTIPEFPQTATSLVLMIILLSMAILVARKRL